MLYLYLNPKALFSKYGIAVLFCSGIIILSSTTFNQPDNPVPKDNFINFETPHVYPLDLTPDGQKLLAVNTADNSLEVFQVTDAGLKPIGHIPVGLDPVSVRAYSNKEAWVVNHISDNISLVDLERGVVVKTLDTENEPCDVVFAGRPEKAFVTCSEPNVVLVYEMGDLDLEPQRLRVLGEDPRMLTVSPDKSKVYGAFFESGNGTTLVSGNGFFWSNLDDLRQKTKPLITTTQYPRAIELFSEYLSSNEKLRILETLLSLSAEQSSMKKYDRTTGFHALSEREYQQLEDIYWFAQQNSPEGSE